MTRPSYPDTPGARGVDTSEDAADFIADAAPLLRARTLRVIRDAGNEGLTADEAAALLGASILSIRPRVTELRQLGEVRSTGARRRNASGCTARVWFATKEQL